LTAALQKYGKNVLGDLILMGFSKNNKLGSLEEEDI